MNLHLPAAAIVAAALRQFPWSHYLLILGRCKRSEEREFYLRLCARERWGKRELERQLRGALFERVVLSRPKLSPVVRQLHPQAETLFKDTYLLDFLDLPAVHDESDLQRSLVAKEPKGHPETFYTKTRAGALVACLASS
jgi:hypothetical protein